MMLARSQPRHSSSEVDAGGGGEGGLRYIKRAVVLVVPLRG